MARLTNLPRIIRDSSIYLGNSCIAANAYCRGTNECVLFKLLARLKYSRTLRRQSRCVPFIGILYVHVRISHKSERKGSSISKLTGLSSSDYSLRYSRRVRGGRIRTGSPLGKLSSSRGNLELPTATYEKLRRLAACRALSSRRAPGSTRTIHGL